jgi:eukaryotic-like serine/threonine-protein kinase
VALAPGTRLGAYEILTLLGSGGMGEVYRARDTRLDRTVAIKVLSSELASDPQLRERFDREARAISSLNHPHICTLHDVGHEGSLDFLVLEYLEGATLESRLAAGSLAFNEAMRIATEIVEALVTAHRAGIVHRDLKPGNVMLTKAGAKLLDFGLAKSTAPVVVSGGLSMLPTTPPNVTAPGAILGTFQYMAPEQVEGLEADARTDIFAFGAVLYEMLTGRKAFEGKTPAGLLGAILKDDPRPVSERQPLAPPALDRAVATCLQKDPDDRWQTSRDMLRALQWAVEPVDPARGFIAPRSRIVSTLPWVIAALLAAALAAAGVVSVEHWRESIGQPVTFTIAAPENSMIATAVPHLAVSADGQQVAFVVTQQGRPVIWLRSLASASTRALAGTEGASYPFWSPDGRQIGFFAGGKLKRIPIAGGPAVSLADSPNARGGTWGVGNVIVFSPSNAGLYRVSPAGGPVSPVTLVAEANAERDLRTANPARGDMDRWPSFLPDGRRFLYTRVATGGDPRLMIGSIDRHDDAALGSIGSTPQYVSGRVLFWRDNNLVMQLFDARAGRMTGDPAPVVEGIAYEFTSRLAAFSVSQTATLVYALGSGRAATRLTWLDRTGKPLGMVGDPSTYFNIALSPNERMIAVSASPGAQTNRDIWLIDAARSTSRRFTFDPGVEANPAWSPDGSRLAFASSNPSGLQVQSVAGGAPELWAPFQGVGGANDWSRDGRDILFWNVTGQTGGDLWIVPVDGDHKPIAFANSTFNEQDGAFSPDGRWIAYSSDESGRFQVYVQPFPTTGEKHPVSNAGGEQPRWRGDGRELFFLAPDGTMMASPVSLSPRFDADVAKPLFQTGIVMSGRRQYAVTGDGQRFLVNAAQPRSGTGLITVVVNWPSTIEKP